MKPLLSCREAAALLLRAQDTGLGWGLRTRLRMHLWICTGCTRFSKQVNLMGGAMQVWRSYRQDESEP